jgi:hypothetical protein
MSLQTGHSFEVQIESGKGGSAHAAVTLSNVTVDLASEEKLQKLLDILEVPKGTRVNISTKASTSIVR